MKYLVSFDLNRPKQEHVKVEKKLKELGGTEVLHTQWILDSSMKAEDYLSYLKALKIFDSNDGILIVKIPDSKARVILGVACQKLLSNMDRSDFF